MYFLKCMGKVSKSLKGTFVMNHVVILFSMIFYCKCYSSFTVVMHLRGKQFWSFKLNHIYLLYKIYQCIEINSNWFSGAKANTGITLWFWGISFSVLFLSVKKLFSENELITDWPLCFFCLFFFQIWGRKALHKTFESRGISPVFIFTE